MWFCLSLLQNSGAYIYRVPPTYLTQENRWNGFGGVNSDDLRRCFDERIKLSGNDIQLGTDLWNVFRTKDRESLVRLTSHPLPSFPYLNEVGVAAAELDSLPPKIIGEIKSEGINNFNEIFLEFRRRAGVFGFGDLQVKSVMEASAS